MPWDTDVPDVYGRGSPRQVFSLFGANTCWWRVHVADDGTSFSCDRDQADPTLGVFSRVGTVFNAATTDWARGLVSGREPAVERITRASSRVCPVH